MEAWARANQLQQKLHRLTQERDETSSWNSASCYQCKLSKHTYPSAFTLHLHGVASKSHTWRSLLCTLSI